MEGDEPLDRAEHFALQELAPALDALGSAEGNTEEEEDARVNIRRTALQKINEFREIFVSLHGKPIPERVQDTYDSLRSYMRYLFDQLCQDPPLPVCPEHATAVSPLMREFFSGVRQG